MVVTAAQIVAIGAFAIAGRWSPRKAQPWWSGELLVDLVTGAALAGLKWTVLAAPVAWIGTRAGLVPIGRLPAPVAWLACFLALDLARYALHRIHHRVPWLWSFHRVHHSSERLDATSGLRMHVVDFLQLSLVPLVLFNLVFDVSTEPAWWLPSLLLPGVLIDAFQHSNLRFPIRAPLGRALDRVLNNPHFHAWHHTAEGASCDGNYGNVLTLWDRLFQTCVSRDTLPARFGLDDANHLVIDPISLQLLRGDPK
jgi:sterol desaturase/sphingolipid hydroxylase (fatty acid hydroxylase superfamily)